MPRGGAWRGFFRQNQRPATTSSTAAGTNHLSDMTVGRDSMPC